jgi:SGNH domain (fused to AT3 domains)
LNVLIIGDSHAAHLWSGLQESYPTVIFLQANVVASIPIIGAAGDDPRCTGMMKFIYEKFLPRTHLDGIIISARWKSDDIQAAIKQHKPFTFMRTECLYSNLLFNMIMRFQEYLFWQLYQINPNPNSLKYIV